MDGAEARQYFTELQRRVLIARLRAWADVLERESAEPGRD